MLDILVCESLAVGTLGQPDTFAECAIVSFAVCGVEVFDGSTAGNAYRHPTLLQQHSGTRRQKTMRVLAVVRNTTLQSSGHTEYKLICSRSRPSVGRRCHVIGYLRYRRYSKVCKFQTHSYSIIYWPIFLPFSRTQSCHLVRLMTRPARICEVRFQNGHLRLLKSS